MTGYSGCFSATVRFIDSLHLAVQGRSNHSPRSFCSKTAGTYKSIRTVGWQKMRQGYFLVGIVSLAILGFLLIYYIQDCRQSQGEVKSLRKRIQALTSEIYSKEKNLDQEEIKLEDIWKGVMDMANRACLSKHQKSPVLSSAERNERTNCISHFGDIIKDVVEDMTHTYQL